MAKVALPRIAAILRILRGLDSQHDRIKSELDEARRLRDDAQALLADYHRKQREAETEVRAIIAGAQAKAGRIAAGTKAKKPNGRLAGEAGRQCAGFRARSHHSARLGRRTARSQKSPARAVTGKIQKLEARLRQMVYAGEIGLDQARREIAGD